MSSEESGGAILRPSAERMAEDMDLEPGDVITDAGDGLAHVVTSVGTGTERVSLLLDSPIATNYDELHDNGLSTSLDDYYHKWRRGVVKKRAHWSEWTEFVDGVSP